MAVNLSPIGNGFQFFTNDGIPLAGGFLYTYLAGSSTPLATYTTSAGNIANANPIVLGTSGRPPQEIWLTDGSSYKFILKDANNVTIATYDNLYGLLQQVTGAPGTVAQVVQATFNSRSSTTSASFVNTAVTASITPTSATSKVLVLINGQVYAYKASNGATGDFQIVRNSTAVLVCDGTTGNFAFGTKVGSSTVESAHIISTAYLDSPATTSSVTYKLQAACNQADELNWQNTNANTSTIVLMEIGA